MRSKRSFVSLLTALTFVVLATTGFLAFARPFSIRIVGLHALIGFVFVALVALHVLNNQGDLKRYLRSRVLWAALAVSLGLTAVFLWQPAPIRALLGLSGNLGPSFDNLEVTRHGLDYTYVPSPNYRMRLTIRAGTTFDMDGPPHVAIWLENASFYHIKTLRTPPEAARAALPYWDFKVRGWQRAKWEAKHSRQGPAGESDVDAISAPTRNSSFDPADYIVPADPDNPLPYRLLIEIDQPDDGQPSLVYAVDIDNADPRVFQLLELIGYPKKHEDDEEGKEVWSLYYIDERFHSALDLIDSALLTIERGKKGLPERPPQDTTITS